MSAVALSSATQTSLRATACRALAEEIYTDQIAEGGLSQTKKTITKPAHDGTHKSTNAGHANHGSGGANNTSVAPADQCHYGNFQYTPEPAE